MTKRTAEAASPKAARYISELPAFGLRIESSGRKTFIARYRAGGGRQGVLRQKSLGEFGVVTTDEARATARKILGPAAGGADPLGERAEARKAGVTVAEVCDWYCARWHRDGFSDGVDGP